MIDVQRFKTDLIALGLLAATVFLGLSLFSYDPADPPAQLVYPVREVAQNLCGATGAHIAHLLRSSFGLGAWGVFLALVVVDMRMFSRQKTSGVLVELLGLALILVSLCVVSQIMLGNNNATPLIGSGGYIGALGYSLLNSKFSIAGSLILLFSMFAAGLLLTADTLPVRILFACLAFPFKAFSREPSDVDEEAEAEEEEEYEEEEEVVAEDEEEYEEEEAPAPKAKKLKKRKPIKVNPPAGLRLARSTQPIEQKKNSSYELPSVDLLEEAENFPFELLARKAEEAAEVLENTFADFGLDIQVSEIDTGPVLTLFELDLKPGLRVAKVTALANDLAVALRVPSVRVVPSIPGKNTVGVEVPNDKQVMVRLRELIESCSDDVDKNRIPLFMGKDVSGHPLTADLAKLPHLLIAGRTGTGKSVCLNTLILSLLMTRTPNEVKMLMIDPKMVELSGYKRIPHLMHPVITDMKKAEAVLAWAVDKMEERYDLLARCGSRNIESFNKLGKAKVLDLAGIDPDSEEAQLMPEKMPSIVIVADEIADMMMTSGKDVEAHIIRLAQKSRAVGIHLVLATQKPTVDVITGLIKSNLPARVSFQVASRGDSRVVLDENGADALLGNGDMLYLAPGTSKLTRAQGAYVSDEEIERVIDFFSDMEPEYSPELAQITASNAKKNGSGDSDRKEDSLYHEAVEVVIREGRGSVSLLQRALGVGYGRGARLIDYMAEDGIVGEYNGSQAREVLYTIDEWEAMKASDFEDDYGEEEYEEELV
ncbi:DNA translocase FtsK [Gimesia panareensis]|uniref:DNA translocase FtsK n=1 Tax=Gimesia panareensis TaxID=2527978 RepID=A0A518FL22_9PLAN|nr:DNA translocase FtsK [Gimesia panareensis]QDV17054.1 DNA translocase FtsK [Gimesia panareensis]